MISDGGWALGNTVPSRAAKAVDSGNGRSFVFVLFRMTSRWPFTTPTVRSPIGRQRKMPASLWHRVQVKPAGKPELGPRYYIDESIVKSTLRLKLSLKKKKIICCPSYSAAKIRATFREEKSFAASWEALASRPSSRSKSVNAAISFAEIGQLELGPRSAIRFQN